MNLKDKIDDFQIQTARLVNLCEYVELTQDCIETEYFKKLLHSVVRIIGIEARRVDEVSDEIFRDKRMVEFCYSDKCAEEIT